MFSWVVSAAQAYWRKPILQARSLPVQHQLANVQELLRINQQLQEQLQATELTLDQSLTNFQESLRIDLELQGRLETAKLALEKSQQEADDAAARNVEAAQKIEAMSARLNVTEQTLTAQRERELDQMRNSNRFALIAAGVIAAGRAFGHSVGRLLPLAHA